MSVKTKASVPKREEMSCQASLPDRDYRRCASPPTRRVRFHASPTVTYGYCDAHGEIVLSAFEASEVR